MKVDVVSLAVRHNEEEEQFELEVDGQVAVLAYFVRDSTIYYPHTEVPTALQRQGLAAKLARYALDYARANGLSVVPRCPYVRAYIRRHPEYADLVEPGR
ncbi:MAG: GNAT family N-acetyltransferase [Tepidiformaceae bacterium]